LEIYADVVFLINFIMDFFIFLIVSKLLKKKTIYKRILSGAFIAAILYCFVIFTPFLRKIYNFFGAVAILMIASLIAFSPKNIKEMIRIVFLSHIAAFSIGGAGIALFYYTDLPKALGNMISFNIKDFPFKVLITVAASSYIILKFSMEWLKSVFSKRKEYYSVKIKFNSIDVYVRALVDTGNSLKDPLTLSPVIIAEFSAVKKFLPDAVKLIYYEQKEENLTEILNNITDSSICGRIRMIPFSSVGVKNGMLLGFVPDEIEVENNEEKLYLKIGK